MSSFKSYSKSYGIYGIDPQYTRYKLMLEHKCVSEPGEEKSNTPDKSEKCIQLLIRGGYFMTYEFANACEFYQFLDTIKVFGLTLVDEFGDINSNTEKISQENNTIEGGVLEVKEKNKNNGLVVTHYDDLLENGRYRRIDYTHFDQWDVKINDITDDKQLNVKYSIKNRGVILKPNEQSKCIGLRYAGGLWLQIIFRYAWEFPVFLKNFNMLGLVEELETNVEANGEKERYGQRLLNKFEQLMERDYRIVLIGNLSDLSLWETDRQFWAHLHEQQEKQKQEQTKQSKRKKSGLMSSFFSTDES